ncbi:sugar phosphorylase [Mesorhizobium sp. M0152]|uniref:sugar phosphorylase n=1 Tax=unclassified Mesorhizobium TaxID=325217 RepID=UPI003335C4D1
MMLRELMKQVENLPPETLVCTAEVDEVFGVNPAGVEVVNNARIGSRKSDGTEAVQLDGGSDKVIVIRW